MKLLTPAQLIELLPVEPDLEDFALSRFEMLTPTEWRQPGFCRAAVAAGWTQPLQVNVNGKPAYVLTYRVTSDGGLWIDICQSLASGVAYEALAKAVDQLARKMQRRYIRFTTARRGIVKSAVAYGYQPEAVMMGKGVYA